MRCVSLTYNFRKDKIMYELLYNSEQNAYHIQNSNDTDALCNGENGWEVICSDPDRSVIEKEADRLQKLRNDSYN